MYHQMFNDVPYQDPPDPKLFGKWAYFEPTSAPPPPRAIEITPEIVAQDEAQRRMCRNSIALEWREKANLSAENLRGYRPCRKRKG